MCLELAVRFILVGIEHANFDSKISDWDAARLVRFVTSPSRMFSTVIGAHIPSDRNKADLTNFYRLSRITYTARHVHAF